MRFSQEHWYAPAPAIWAWTSPMDFPNKVSTGFPFIPARGLLRIIALIGVFRAALQYVQGVST
jgi:hypothetical protein